MVGSSVGSMFRFVHSTSVQCEFSASPFLHLLHLTWMEEEEVVVVDKEEEKVIEGKELEEEVVEEEEEEGGWVLCSAISRSSGVTSPAAGWHCLL